MRLIFLGTPAFAVPTLEAIVRAGHEVAAVLTQPDRPRGRGQNAAASPVKQAALGLGLTVYQPERVRRPEAVEYLRGIDSDAMVVVGYGQIIPQVAIDLAPLGIINVHASLLPKYRGAGPIQWALVRGETRTGVTSMRCWTLGICCSKRRPKSAATRMPWNSAGAWRSWARACWWRRWRDCWGAR